MQERGPLQAAGANFAVGIKTNEWYFSSKFTFDSIDFGFMALPHDKPSADAADKQGEFSLLITFSELFLRHLLRLWRDAQESCASVELRTLQEYCRQMSLYFCRCRWQGWCEQRCLTDRTGPIPEADNAEPSREDRQLLDPDNVYRDQEPVCHQVRIVYCRSTG